MRTESEQAMSDHGESLRGMPDMSAAARRANAKLQAIENSRAIREGRDPIDVREQMLAKRRALREALIEAQA